MRALVVAMALAGSAVLVACGVESVEESEILESIGVDLDRPGVIVPRSNCVQVEQVLEEVREEEGVAPGPACVSDRQWTRDLSRSCKGNATGARPLFAFFDRQSGQALTPTCETLEQVFVRAGLRDGG